MTDVFEYTYDADGLSETAYRPTVAGGSTNGDLLVSEVVTVRPDILLPPFPTVAKWKVIGKTHTNGINYFEDTIALSVDGPTPTSLLEYLDIPVSMTSSQSTGYTLKVGLKTGKVVVKEYVIDTTTWRPSIPPDAVTNGELGRHLNDPHLTTYRDFYLMTTLPDDELRQWFGVPIPCVSTTHRYLGVLYCLETRQVVKLKVYTYPQHGAIVEMNHDKFHSVQVTSNERMDNPD